MRRIKVHIFQVSIEFLLFSQYFFFAPDSMWTRVHLFPLRKAESWGLIDSSPHISPKNVVVQRLDPQKGRQLQSCWVFFVYFNPTMRDLETHFKSRLDFDTRRHPLVLWWKKQFFLVIWEKKSMTWKCNSLEVISFNEKNSVEIYYFFQATITVDRKRVAHICLFNWQ